MRRRVSREQLLDASQSILSPRVIPKCRGGGMSFALMQRLCLLTVARWAKGKPAKIPVPGSGTDCSLSCGPLVAPQGVARFVAVTRQDTETPAGASGRVIFSPEAAEALETSWRERGFWLLCEERRQHGAASGELLPGP